MVGSALRAGPLAIAATLVACSSSPGASRTYSGTYLSLGDSLAQGRGVSNADISAFAPLLAHDEGKLNLRNFGAGGSTTKDVIDKQLPRALAVLTNDKMAFITISVGFNDVGDLLATPACADDSLPAACPMDETLGRVEANIDAVMTQLRRAAAVTPIVVLLYPTFLSGAAAGRARRSPLVGEGQDALQWRPG